MFILVDYDNVKDRVKNSTVEIVIDKLIDTLRNQSSASVNAASELRFRLYGGWFDDQGTLSRDGQPLSVAIQAAFPKIRIVTRGGRRESQQTIVELARSLLVDPSRELHHTFREKQFNYSVRCKNPSDVCVRAGCPLQSTYRFISKSSCPEVGCSVTARDLILRNEQKMVDGMLMSDLLHISESGADAVVVVSSDDDLWPAMIHALAGRKVRLIHVQSRQENSTRHNMVGRYLTGMREHYHTMTLGD